MNTIQSKWEDYLTEVIGIKCDDNFDIEAIKFVRNAFYGGAAGAISIIAKACELNQNARNEIHKGLIEEIHNYAKSLKVEG